jgi:hypothetical protein
MEVAASFGGSSKIEYLSKDGRRFTLAALRDLEKSSKAEKDHRS